MTIHKASWLLAGLVCPALWPAHAAAQGEKWENQMHAAFTAFQQGRYATAEIQFLAAIKEADEFGAQDPRLARSLNDLAVVYSNLGRYAEAEPLFKRSLAILEAVSVRKPRDVICASRSGDAPAWLRISILGKGLGVPSDCWFSWPLLLPR